MLILGLSKNNCNKGKNKTPANTQPQVHITQASYAAAVIGQLARGARELPDRRMKVIDPQDWWSSLGLGLVRYCSDS